MSLTESAKREFLKCVVEKTTTACWSWACEHDESGRPVFRGEKAYRMMYELRIGEVPRGFHVHRKCENSACVNLRHLVALSPEAHRAVHSTKDKALKERIYAGEWEQIQAAKAEAARLRAEAARLERERQERLAKERFEEQQLELRRTEWEQRQFREAAQWWGRNHPVHVALRRVRHLLVGLTCLALIWLLWRFSFSDPHTSGWLVFFALTFWFVAPLAVLAYLQIRWAFAREVPLPRKVSRF